MRKMTILALATLGATLFTSAAYAEPKKDKKSEDYGYSFEDDALLGGDLGTQTAVIKVRQKGMRDKLIRPRVQFVSELLKSVEAL